ncbi:hypothetical protein GCM10027048_45110 [Hymenobacter coalescens]
MTLLDSSAQATLFFDNPAGRILHHPVGYIRLDWHRAPSRDAHVRALYEAATEALCTFGLTRILTDHRHMPPISAAMQRWLADEWVPSTVRRCGYNRGAIIQAFNLFNRLATSQIVSQVGHVPLTLQYFDHEQEAERWLLDEA